MYKTLIILAILNIIIFLLMILNVDSLVIETFYKIMSGITLAIAIFVLFYEWGKP
jgi:hypothetical protein